MIPETPVEPAASPDLPTLLGQFLVELEGTDVAAIWRTFGRAGDVIFAHHTGRPALHLLFERPVLHVLMGAAGDLRWAMLVPDCDAATRDALQPLLAAVKALLQNELVRLWAAPASDEEVAG